MTQIREIQPHDNLTLAAVIRSIFISDRFPLTGTAFADVQLDHMYEVFAVERSVYFVVEKEGKIVGGCGIAPLANAPETICELQKMYFLPEVRGMGLGKAILELCLRKAKEMGYEKCYLETLPEMKVAQHLYKLFGFEYLCSPMGNTGHTSCPIWMIKNLK